MDSLISATTVEISNTHVPSTPSLQSELRSLCVARPRAVFLKKDTPPWSLAFYVLVTGLRGP